MYSFSVLRVVSLKIIAYSFSRWACDMQAFAFIECRWCLQRWTDSYVLCQSLLLYETAKALNWPFSRVSWLWGVGAGHNSVLHACTLEDEAFVGMGATILDGAVVEKGAMVAAGALITQNTRVPTGQVQFFQLISILTFNSIYL